MRYKITFFIAHATIKKYAMKPPIDCRVVLCVMLYLWMRRYCSEKQACMLSEHKSALALNRRQKTRILWSDLQKRMSNNCFQQMFRMSRKYFKLLCSKIVAAIVESAFKSEAYIAAVLSYDAVMMIGVA